MARMLGADWIIFIMLSSLVMLNLVVGVVCSAMAQATEDHKALEAKLSMMDRLVETYEVPRKVLDAWALVRALLPLYLRY